MWCHVCIKYGHLFACSISLNECSDQSLELPVIARMGTSALCLRALAPVKILHFFTTSAFKSIYSRHQSPRVNFKEKYFMMFQQNTKFHSDSWNIKRKWRNKAMLHKSLRYQKFYIWTEFRNISMWKIASCSMRMHSSMKCGWLVTGVHLILQCLPRQARWTRRLQVCIIGTVRARNCSHK